MKRQDDFNKRREHLKNLTDEELKNRFWELAGNLVDPMIELAYKNTSPSIERSILLRMGFSSIEAKSILEGVLDRNLMSKGAGHVVYKLAKELEISVREAGLKLADGHHWDDVERLFRGGVESCV